MKQKYGPLKDLKITYYRINIDGEQPDVPTAIGPFRTEVAAQEFQKKHLVGKVAQLQAVETSGVPAVKILQTLEQLDKDAEVQKMLEAKENDPKLKAKLANYMRTLWGNKNVQQR